jgi:cell volume regulation protein A
LRGLSIEVIFLIISVLLLLSIAASKISSRLGIPALLLFLGLGMVAGSEGPGGIYFDDPWLTQLFGSLALAYILFAGGMSTRWSAVRRVLAPSLTLATLGVIVTTAVVALFAVLVFRFSPLEGFLLGAIVSSTDAAAVFSILKSNEVRLAEPLEPLLEFESGSNDPMAVFLTIGFTTLVMNPEQSVVSLLPLFLLQFSIGGVLGVALGWGAVRLLNAVQLREDGLYPVLSTGVGLFIYAVTAALGGSGFLAVYIAGLILGNSAVIHRRSMMRFHDGLAWLMQIGMFLVLGLLVFPSELPSVVGGGLLFALVLIFVARPVAVFLSLIPFRFSVGQKLMIAWVGLRGAVPIILATLPLLAGVPRADFLFNLVFFAVLSSVLLQGTLIPRLAVLLKVAATGTQPEAANLQDEFADSAGGELAELRIPPRSAAVGRRIVELGLPNAAIVVLIKRGGQFLIPRGGVQLQADDRVLVAADRQAMDTARRLLTRPHHPPE